MRAELEEADKYFLPELPFVHWISGRKQDHLFSENALTNSQLAMLRRVSCSLGSRHVSVCRPLLSRAKLLCLQEERGITVFRR